VKDQVALKFPGIRVNAISSLRRLCAEHEVFTVDEQLIELLLSKYWLNHPKKHYDTQQYSVCGVVSFLAYAKGPRPRPVGLRPAGLRACSKVQMLFCSGP
jgi:hypothetical protein